jgi:FkbM family methyltransferase
VGVAGVITRSFEMAGLRGAPTLLRYLSKFVGGVATVELPSGERMSFPAFDPYWARHLYAGVPFEPDVEAIFRRFAEGRILIDCGANIGYWSVRAKGIGFSDAVAIEANPSLIPLLKHNHGGRVIHGAVHSGSNKTVYIVGSGATGHIDTFGEPVKTVALRDLGIVGPVLVKLDVEGAEIEAIKGAEGMEAIFVYEDWPRSGMLVTDYLLEHGFEVEGFDGTRIRTHDEALAFNKRTNTLYGPSNFAARSTT